MTDKNFLSWVYNRMVHMHGEDENFDYMRKFRSIIDSMQEEQRDTIDEYAYQVAYDLSNDWMRETPTWHDVETACKLGAEWKKQQMMKDAVDAKITLLDGISYVDKEVLAKYNSKDKVKVIIIKED